MLLSLVLCCLRDKTGTMEQAWRILRPGGRALITYPRAYGLLRPSKRSFRVTGGVWAALLGHHPWQPVLPPFGRLVRHHLIEKPTPSTRSPA